MRNIIIDTDPGIDDVLALLYALHTDDVNVRAITTVHGNTNVDQTTQNTLTMFKVIEAHQKHLSATSDFQDSIPWKIFSKPVIAKGAAWPYSLSDQTSNVNAVDVHGSDGLGGVLAKDGNISEILDTFRGFVVTETSDKIEHDRNTGDKCSLYTLSSRDAADEVLHQLEHEPPHTLTIIALGPLTNIAIALDRDPSMTILSKVKGIVVMGGCIHHPCPGGNITPHAEFNFYADPAAANRVLSSGLPITLIPLDVTETCRLNYGVYKETIVPMAQKAPLPSFISGFLEHLYNFMANTYEDGMFGLENEKSTEIAGKLNTKEDHVLLPYTGNEVRVPPIDPEYFSDRPFLKNDLIESDNIRHVRITHSTSLAMHDPLAMGVLLDPEIVIKRKTISVGVETDHSARTRGMCLVDGRIWKKRIFAQKKNNESVSPRNTVDLPAIEVVFQVDTNRFFAKFMRSVFGVTWEKSKHAWISSLAPKTNSD